MLFKMLSIQRTWEQHPNMGPKPRQVFITQSQVLATKVEEYFANLMLSFEAPASSLEGLRAMERDVEQEPDLVAEDDAGQRRPDLPERFSELSDEHFPLFITYDLVRIPFSSKDPISSSCEQLCTMLQKDVGRGDRDDGLIIPKMHVPGDDMTSPTSPTSPWKSGLNTGPGSTSSSDYMQKTRRDFVSYGEFLASYWGRFSQDLTRGLGKQQRPTHDAL